MIHGGGRAGDTPKRESTLGVAAEAKVAAGTALVNAAAVLGKFGTGECRALGSVGTAAAALGGSARDTGRIMSELSTSCIGTDGACIADFESCCL